VRLKEEVTKDAACGWGRGTSERRSMTRRAHTCLRTDNASQCQVAAQGMPSRRHEARGARV